MTQTEINLIARALGCNLDTGPWIAGSAAAWAAADGPEVFTSIKGPRDVDVFFRDEVQLLATLARLAELGATGEPCRGVGNSNEAGDPDPEQPIDGAELLYGKAWNYDLCGVKVNVAAMAFWPNVIDLLAGFDFTVCQCATDGLRNQWTPAGFSDYGRCSLVLLRETRTDRVIRYVGKGYTMPGGNPKGWEDVPGKWRADFRLRDAIVSAIRARVRS